MKLRIFLNFFLPVLFTLSSVQTVSAVKRVVIAGDMTCSGSTDGVLVKTESKTSTRCLVPSSGVYALPGSTVSSTTMPYVNEGSLQHGSQTMIAGLHDVLSSFISEDIVYVIVAQDKGMDEWVSDAAFLKSLSPDYIVWMHGSKDIENNIDAETYRTGLSRFLDNFKDTKTVLVQPANSGRVYASRPLESEYTMPQHGIESVICKTGSERGIPVIPAYACDICQDGRTPRATSMVRLGEMVAKSFQNPAAATYAVTLKETTPFSITLTVKAEDGSVPGITSTFALPAPDAGFEVWRTAGGTARRLNITSVEQRGVDFIISTNERLAGGDQVVYGCSSTGSGRYDGCRGNLANMVPVPVFALMLNRVTSPDDNVTGTITCNGTGVAGVTVSDGYAFGVTDAEGKYSLSSQKRLGYVFYILPSGYEPETEDNGWQVKIHSQFASSDPSVAEVHDFRLKKADNDRHILLVGADSHLAARNQDKSQFKSGFMKSVKDFVKANPNVKIYSTILGDMSWDQYWYANDYALPDFVETMTTQGFPVSLFPVMGNHDNDGATPAGADCDFNAAKPFRKYMAPTYYSYNLGKVHYVVLDDIVYKNTYTAGKSYSEGIVGDRDYGKYYTDEQMEWLRHDLELIQDKSTPVVVCFHIQNWALSTNGAFTVNANLDSGASEKLAEILSDFSEVHLLSGHTHYNFHAHPPKYPNIHENNVAGICATWWWTGKLVDRHICKDGSPGGYAVYTVDGKNISWKYRSVDTGDDEDTQFRVYDMNAVKKAYANDADIKNWLKYDSSQTNYATIADNTIYVNVFNYDTDWTVEILEGDKPLSVKRITAQDPLHVICYEVPRYKAASTVTADFVTNRTNHMFSATATTANLPVTVRVTDTFGRTYTKTVNRPGTFDTSLH